VSAYVGSSKNLKDLKDEPLAVGACTVPDTASQSESHCKRSMCEVRVEGMRDEAERGARAWATVTVVSTTTLTPAAAARSLLRKNCSVTDAMATLEAATETASATLCMYASREGMPKDTIDMEKVAVNITATVQSEHAAQGPPSPPSNPGEQ